MRMKTLILLLLGLALSASAIFYFNMMRPKIFVHAFSTEPDLNAVGLLPLEDHEEDEWKALIEAAKEDSAVAFLLLNKVRDQYGKSGIEVPKIDVGIYSTRCRRGHAMVYHLDEEGYAYFDFVNVDGRVNIKLDEPENGILLVRSTN